MLCGIEKKLIHGLVNLQELCRKTCKAAAYQVAERMQGHLFRTDFLPPVPEVLAYDGFQVVFVHRACSVVWFAIA